MFTEEMCVEIDRLREENATLRQLMFNLLCRFREWEPSFFDSGRTDTDLGQAITKAKQALAGKEGE